MLSPRWQLVWDDGPPVDRVLHYDVAAVAALVDSAASAYAFLVVAVLAAVTVVVTTWTPSAVTAEVLVVAAVVVFLVATMLAPKPFAVMEIEPFPPSSLSWL